MSFRSSLQFQPLLVTLYLICLVTLGIMKRGGVEEGMTLEMSGGGGVWCGQNKGGGYSGNW